MKFAQRLGVMLILTGICGTALAQQRQDVPARIALKDTAGAIDVLLTGRRGQIIHARLGENAPGTITYDAGDIRRMLITLPQDAIRQAESSAAAGNTSEAVRRMRAVIQPVIPYLDLPVEGVVDQAFRYAEFLRRERSWAAAISVYRALNGNPDATVRQQATGWLAYCHVRNQENKEAQDILSTLQVEDPRHAGFIPANVAGAWLKLTANDEEGALDLAARATSLARIDHELYPESVFVSAMAYARFSDKLSEKPSQKEVVLRRSGDEEAPMPAVTADECRDVAIRQFTRLVELFPSSPFSADATKQLETLQKNDESTPTTPLNESGATP
ncbi:MAG TPA: hypothetical protein PJ991_12785 [Kiritimatiellia bacterium]|nr:hypothetical protein [Kiritimatiellia bacterium]